MSLFGKKKKKKAVLPKGAKLGDRETLIRKLPNQGKRAITFERKKKKLKGKKTQECWVIVNNEPVTRGRPKGSPNKKKKGNKK